VGGLVPLLPYMLLEDNMQALAASVAITLLALAVFGAVKGRFTGAALWRSAMQTVSIGGLAASAAYALARLFHSH
jgi:vacuolar iron transporter family protein